MSTPLQKQTVSTKMLYDGPRGATFGYGTSVPADASVGWAPNALFLDTNATGGVGLYINRGTRASSNFDAYNGGLDLSTLTTTATELNLLSGLTASAADINALDNQALSVTAGAGITGGTGTVYAQSVQKLGTMFITRIMIDLTGLQTSTTDLDIIGQGASVAHLGRITAAVNGTILFGRMMCFETPATGADDIDLYDAESALGVFDGGIAALTGSETALVTKGGPWAAGDVTLFGAVPTANRYLYLTNGEAGTVGTFTAGQFLIEMYGY